MKKIYSRNQSALLAIMLLCMAALSSCTKSNLAPQDPIKFTWTVTGGSVMQDGVDVTSDYAGMTFTFGNGTYATTNAHKLFNSTGAWKWEDGSKTIIHLNTTSQDAIGIPVQVSINGNTLTMTFSLDITHVNVNGRVEGTVGNYVVVMKR